jgi:hypothetical protein
MAIAAKPLIMRWVGWAGAHTDRDMPNNALARGTPYKTAPSANGETSSGRGGWMGGVVKRAPTPTAAASLLQAATASTPRKHRARAGWPSVSGTKQAPAAMQDCRTGHTKAAPTTSSA